MKIKNVVRIKNLEPVGLLVSCGHILLILRDNSLAGLLEKCWALKAIEELDFSS